MVYEFEEVKTTRMIKKSTICDVCEGKRKPHAWKKPEVITIYVPSEYDSPISTEDDDMEMQICQDCLKEKLGQFFHKTDPRGYY